MFSDCPNTRNLRTVLEQTHRLISHRGFPERLLSMADANVPSDSAAFVSGERWTMTDAGHIQKVFRMLDIPPMGGFRPVAITVVGVLESPNGELAHYPLFAQLSDTDLSEAAELRAAISILQGWLRLQRQSRRHGPEAG
jgi:hypothetical protein